MIIIKICFIQGIWVLSIYFVTRYVLTNAIPIHPVYILLLGYIIGIISQHIPKPKL